MKYEEIVALIEKAGFNYASEGRGIGLAEGRTVSYYRKDNNGSCKSIQLATLENNKNDILPIFSNNVPEKLRDAVYNIMNSHSMDLTHSLQL